jgi:signal transduction histidine kinase
MNKRRSRPKCLLVDDLEANILALKAMLAEEEMEIISAASGVEALELLLEHEFALALVDVQMPSMDGFELAEIMRSTEKTRSIPIIFVTAETDAARIFQGYEAGAVDFLQKPLLAPVVKGKVRIFLDLFNQKKLLEEKLQKLEETEKNLQQALKSRDEFLSICSHELKTPLTSLKMQIQMTNRLREKRGDAEALSVERVTKFIDQADRSADRLVHLVNDMLDISRVATGRLSLNMEEVDISELVREVVERLRFHLQEANVKITLKLRPGVSVTADRFRIEQVLTNLITNVAKYAPDAPMEVIAEMDAGHAIIQVVDHGSGIPLQDQKRIFQRFERAISAQSISGMGLGLYISKEIVEMHQGRIELKSSPGQGSTFTVTLPLVSG